MNFNLAINFKSYLFQDEAINPVPGAQENHPRHSEAETDKQQHRTPLHDGPIGSCLTAKNRVVQRLFTQLNFVVLTIWEQIENNLWVLSIQFKTLIV